MLESHLTLDSNVMLYGFGEQAYRIDMALAERMLSLVDGKTVKTNREGNSCVTFLPEGLVCKRTTDGEVPGAGLEFIVHQLHNEIYPGLSAPSTLLLITIEGKPYPVQVSLKIEGISVKTLVTTPEFIQHFQSTYGEVSCHEKFTQFIQLFQQPRNIPQDATNEAAYDELVAYWLDTQRWVGQEKLKELDLFFDGRSRHSEKHFLFCLKDVISNECLSYVLQIEKKFPELFSKQTLSAIAEWPRIIRALIKYFPDCKAAELFDEGSRIFDRIDKDSLSAHTVATLIKKPEDDKPDNLYATVKQDSQNKPVFHIVCIDNDMSFFDPIVATPEGYYIELKSVILRPELQRYAMSEHFRDYFLNTKPALALCRFLSKMKYFDEQCRQWIDKGYIKKQSVKQSIGVPIQLMYNLALQLFLTWRDCQMFLKTNPSATNSDLFYTIEPIIHAAYHVLAAWKKKHNKARSGESLLYSHGLSDRPPTLEDLLGERGNSLALDRPLTAVLEVIKGTPRATSNRKYDCNAIMQYYWDGKLRSQLVRQPIAIQKEILLILARDFSECNLGIMHVHPEAWDEAMLASAGELKNLLYRIDTLTLVNKLTAAPLDCPLEEQWKFNTYSLDRNVKPELFETMIEQHAPPSLLEAAIIMGIDPNAPTAKNKFPLHKAIWSSHGSALELLATYNVDLEIVDRAGISALTKAVRKNNLGAIDTLISYGAGKRLNAQLVWNYFKNKMSFPLQIEEQRMLAVIRYNLAVNNSTFLEYITYDALFMNMKIIKSSLNKEAVLQGFEIKDTCGDVRHLPKSITEQFLPQFYSAIDVRVSWKKFSHITDTQTSNVRFLPCSPSSLLKLTINELADLLLYNRVARSQLLYFNPVHSKSYPVLLTSFVPGINMQDLIENKIPDEVKNELKVNFNITHFDDVWNCIDHQSYTEFLLLSFLVSFDGCLPSDFMLCPKQHSDGMVTWSIHLNIECDVFAKPTIKDEIDNIKLNMRNIFFCLPNILKPLDERTIQRHLENDLEIYNILDSWVKNVTVSHEQVFSTFNSECFAHFPLKRYHIKKILSRWKKITNRLEGAYNLTGLQLLHEISPFAAKEYTFVIHSNLTLLEKFSTILQKNNFRRDNSVMHIIDDDNSPTTKSRQAHHKCVSDLTWKAESEEVTQSIEEYRIIHELPEHIFRRKSTVKSDVKTNVSSGDLFNAENLMHRRRKSSRLSLRYSASYSPKPSRLSLRQSQEGITSRRLSSSLSTTSEDNSFPSPAPLAAIKEHSGIEVSRKASDLSSASFSETNSDDSLSHHSSIKKVESRETELESRTSVSSSSMTYSDTSGESFSPREDTIPDSAMGNRSMASADLNSSDTMIDIKMDFFINLLRNMPALSNWGVIEEKYKQLKPDQRSQLINQLNFKVLKRIYNREVESYRQHEDSFIKLLLNYELREKLILQGFDLLTGTHIKKITTKGFITSLEITSCNKIENSDITTILLCAETLTSLSLKKLLNITSITQKNSLQILDVDDTGKLAKMKKLIIEHMPQLESIVLTLVSDLNWLSINNCSRLHVIKLCSFHKYDTKKELIRSLKTLTLKNLAKFPFECAMKYLDLNTKLTTVDIINLDVKNSRLAAAMFKRGYYVPEYIREFFYYPNDKRECVIDLSSLQVKESILEKLINYTVPIHKILMPVLSPPSVAVVAKLLNANIMLMTKTFLSSDKVHVQHHKEITGNVTKVQTINEHVYLRLENEQLLLRKKHDEEIINNSKFSQFIVGKFYSKKIILAVPKDYPQTIEIMSLSGRCRQTKLTLQNQRRKQSKDVLITVMLELSHKKYLVGNPNNTIKLFVITIMQKDPYDLSLKEVASILAHPEPGDITALYKFSDTLLLSGNSNGLISIINLNNYNPMANLMGHRAAVLSFAATQDRYVISIANDNLVKIWDILEYRCIKTIANIQQPLSSLLMLSSRFFFVGTKDGSGMIKSINNPTKNIATHQINGVIQSSFLSPYGVLYLGTNQGLRTIKFNSKKITSLPKITLSIEQIDKKIVLRSADGFSKKWLDILKSSPDFSWDLTTSNEEKLTSLSFGLSSSYQAKMCLNYLTQLLSFKQLICEQLPHNMRKSHNKQSLNCKNYQLRTLELNQEVLLLDDCLRLFELCPNLDMFKGRVWLRRLTDGPNNRGECESLSPKHSALTDQIHLMALLPCHCILTVSHANTPQIWDVSKVLESKQPIVSTTGGTMGFLGLVHKSDSAQQNEAIIEKTKSYGFMDFTPKAHTHPNQPSFQKNVTGLLQLQFGRMLVLLTKPVGNRKGKWKSKLILYDYKNGTPEHINTMKLPHKVVMLAHIPKTNKIAALTKKTNITRETTYYLRILNCHRSISITSNEKLSFFHTPSYITVNYNYILIGLKNGKLIIINSINNQLISFDNKSSLLLTQSNLTDTKRFTSKKHKLLNPITALTMSNANTVVVGTLDGKMTSYSLDNSFQLKSIANSGDAAVRFLKTITNQYIISISDNHELRLWDINTLSCNAVFKQTLAINSCLALSDGRIVTSSKHELRIWNPQSIEINLKNLDLNIRDNINEKNRSLQLFFYAVKEDSLDDSAQQYQDYYLMLTGCALSCFALNKMTTTLTIRVKNLEEFSRLKRAHKIIQSRVKQYQEHTIQCINYHTNTNPSHTHADNQLLLEDEAIKRIEINHIMDVSEDTDNSYREHALKVSKLLAHQLIVLKKYQSCVNLLPITANQKTMEATRLTKKAKLLHAKSSENTQLLQDLEERSRAFNNYKAMKLMIERKPQLLQYYHKLHSQFKQILQMSTSFLNRAVHNKNEKAESSMQYSFTTRSSIFNQQYSVVDIPPQHKNFFKDKLSDDVLKKIACLIPENQHEIFSKYAAAELTCAFYKKIHSTQGLEVLIKNERLHRSMSLCSPSEWMSDSIGSEQEQQSIQNELIQQVIQGFIELCQQEELTGLSSRNNPYAKANLCAKMIQQGMSESYTSNKSMATYTLM